MLVLCLKPSSGILSPLEWHFNSSLWLEAVHEPACSFHFPHAHSLAPTFQVGSGPNFKLVLDLCVCSPLSSQYPLPWPWHHLKCQLLLEVAHDYPSKVLPCLTRHQVTLSHPLICFPHSLYRYFFHFLFIHFHLLIICLPLLILHQNVSLRRMAVHLCLPHSLIFPVHETVLGMWWVVNHCLLN